MSTSHSTVSAVGRTVLYRIGVVALVVIVALDVIALVAYLMT
ncbi:hypothetical protein P3W24_05240 [Luteibacter sp. PPL201]|uniref:Uncharacterized protein n=1 Tax=Luteibacter sahnii TaxID=3021977 RepID=A0ABT6B8F3_9GAMM|nr:hypothetical protein [Luteibacter sp. PPL193]MDY1547725.1 hypothetical protein [Luteibacter sp. PPL193]